MSRAEDAEEVLLALGMPLQAWQVVSPTYTVHSYLEPPESWCDSVLVEAKTKRDALILAVKLMRLEPRRYRFINEDHRCCPYTQLKVFKWPD